jgi:hypothetical protein
MTALLTVFVLALAPSAATAAFGDAFGVAPINQPGAQTAPAIPGTHAFWAGTCDLAAFTGTETPIPDGFGSRPNTILAPNFPSFPVQQPVPAPSVPDHCIDWGAQTLYPFQANVWQSIPWAFQPAPPGEYAPKWRLAPVTQAGSRPDATTLFALRRNTDGVGTAVNKVDGALDDVRVDLPAGFVANPNALPKCTAEQFAVKPLGCPPQTQIGILRMNIEAVPFAGSNLLQAYDTTYPLYNLEPRRGRPAEIGFGYASGEGIVTVRLQGRARTNGDFGIVAFTGQIPSALAPIAQAVTLWGVPWEASNDIWRAPQAKVAGCGDQPGAAGGHYIPPGGLSLACQRHYDPTWGDTPSERSIKPFLTNETDCNPSPIVTLTMDSFQDQGDLTAEGDPDLADSDWKRYSSTSPAVTGCEQLDFQPDVEFSPTTSRADDATGLEVELSLPQNNELPFAPPTPGAGQAEIDQYVADATAHWGSSAGLATAHLKDTEVTLPPGVAVNPSGARGLQGCSNAEIGYLAGEGRFNNEDPFNDHGPECPDGSLIGTAEVRTPLLDEPLTGQLVLGAPESTDPQSGKMFRLFVVIRNEERGLLVKLQGSVKADPGTGQLTASFLDNPELPFEALSLRFKGGASGLLAMPQTCGQPGWTSTFTPWSAAYGAGGQSLVDSGAFSVNSNCAFGFAPTLLAGMDSPQAGGGGSFAFEISRRDGEQWFRGIRADLPPGLLASIKGVPLCSDAKAAAGSCPAASRLGSVDASAGSGEPFVLERKGDVYLTEGYKGGAFGLMVKLPVEAGPFRGDTALSPIVVRQALHVDPTDASVSVVSDPLPLVHHGIPLRARRITVVLDRPGFMRNPTDCSTKQIETTLTSAEGTQSSASTTFNATGCKALAFKPRLSMRLTGRNQTETGGHPGVRVLVTQKSGEALDPDNAKALCEFEDGMKPEPTCPAGSVVGRARAVSPLLNRPLRGKVFFVKNVRRSASDNLIRTTPMLVVALRGEIAINLRGKTTAKGGKLVNVFKPVPDAPISGFRLRLAGGKNGILVVTGPDRDICGRQIAQVNMDGHNGERFDRDTRIKTPCSGRERGRRR